MGGGGRLGSRGVGLLRWPPVSFSPPPLRTVVVIAGQGARAVTGSVPATAAVEGLVRDEGVVVVVAAAAAAAVVVVVVVVVAAAAAAAAVVVVVVVVVVVAAAVAAAVEVVVVIVVVVVVAAVSY